MSDRYEKIRKALSMGPTPGPWEVADGNSYLGIKANSAPIAALHVRVGVAKMHANAHHIAACDPDTIRALLEERDALREALEIARDFVAEALARERDAYRGHESVSSIADIERYLAQIDAALAQGEP